MNGGVLGETPSLDVFLAWLKSFPSPSCLKEANPSHMYEGLEQISLIGSERECQIVRVGPCHMYICTYVYQYTCVHMHFYIYIYTYVCMYMYTSLSCPLSLSLSRFLCFL